MKKLWEGRFTKNTNALLEKFNASITFDKRMYAEDIKGSIAHSKMLSKQEIISQDDQTKIEKGLNQIKLEIENGTFIFKIEDEDMVCEEGKYYPMMRAVKTEQDETWNRLNDQTIAVCDIYGPLLLRNGNPVLRRFLVRQHGQLTQILQTLEAQKESEQIIRRIAEVQEKLQQNESAYTILGAIKSAGI